MHHKINHTVLAYIVDDRHTRRWQREQYARESAQRQHDNEQGMSNRADPNVRTHLVFTMQIDINKDESNAEDDADSECSVFCKSVKHIMPDLSHIEKESAAENIAQVEP